MPASKRASGERGWLALAVAAALSLVAAVLVVGELARRAEREPVARAETALAATAVTAGAAVQEPAPTEPRGAAAAEPVGARAAAVPWTPARLELVFESHLSSGTIAVWLDGERVWLDDLAGSRNPFRRMAGQEVRHTLDVPPGERTVEVRVSGRAAGRRVDAARVIAGRFVDDEARRLRVGLSPLTRELDLAWME
jgi:hypothetical protein